MPKLRTTWSLLIGVVLFVILLGIGVLPRLRQNAELVAASTAPDAGLVRVSVAPPRRSDGPIDLVLPSNIQAIEETTIYARTNGYVRERYVDIGAPVTAGKVLAQIDTPELDQELSQARAALAQTRSALAQARASYTQAQANLSQSRAGLDQSKANESFAKVTAERFGKLERDELVAHQDADEKRTALAAASATTAVSQAHVEAMQANLGALEASVEAARANVAANEANVQRLMALQSFQKVEAPFAGIITARGTDRGALITSGQRQCREPPAVPGRSRREPPHLRQRAADVRPLDRAGPGGPRPRTRIPPTTVRREDREHRGRARSRLAHAPHGSAPPQRGSGTDARDVRPGEVQPHARRRRVGGPRDRAHRASGRTASRRGAH